MSDRASGFLVILEHDVSDEWSKRMVDAIGALKYVTKVEPVPADISQDIADCRARDELGAKLLGVLYPERFKP